MSDLVRFLSLALAFFAVSGLVIALFVGRNCLRSDPESAIAEEIRGVPPAFKISAIKLVEAYLDDEKNAEAIYNGQVGIIEGASLGFVDESNHFQFFGNGIWRVRCFASDAEAEKVWAMRNSFRSTNVYQRDRSGVSVRSAALLLMKGRVEGVNDKHLSIDIRGCTLQDSP